MTFLLLRFWAWLSYREWATFLILVALPIAVAFWTAHFLINTPLWLCLSATSILALITTCFWIMDKYTRLATLLEVAFLLIFVNIERIVRPQRK